MDDPDIQLLVDEARDGNAEAWNRLHALCQPRLLADAQRLLGRNWHTVSPRDLTQETWLRAQLYLDSYRGDGFFGWLGAIMRNVCRNVQRRQRNRSQPLELFMSVSDEEMQRGMAAAHAASGEDSVSQPLVDAEMAATIHEAIRSLDPEMRAILKLSLGEPRLTFQEIGEQLGLTAKQVRDRYHGGLQMLRRKLRGLGE